MRLNWVVILLAAILILLVLVFVVDVSVSEEGNNDRGGPAAVAIR